VVSTQIESPNARMLCTNRPGDSVTVLKIGIPLAGRLSVSSASGQAKYWIPLPA